MALLTYYDDRNKVESELLKIYLYQQYHSGSTYGYRRVATKRYSYEGMDKATALSCMYEKTSQYQYYESLYDQQLSATKKNLVQGANVQALHDAGEMYRVEIDVNVNDECAFRHDLSSEPTPEEINSHFFLQDFDEDGDGNGGVILENDGNGEIAGG